jgi:hypothetical protein
MAERYREIGGTEPQKFLPHVERMCSSIWRAPKCYTISMASSPRAESPSRSSACGQVRDDLQADGLAEKTDSTNWTWRMDNLPVI